MKKSIVGALVIVVCAFAWIFVFSVKNKEIATIKPQYRDIKNEIELSGKVQSENIYNVTSTLTAQVENVFIKIGDKVQKGDTLYQLDDGGLGEQLEELKQELEASSETSGSDIIVSAQSGMDYEALNSLVEQERVKQAGALSAQSQLSAQIEKIEQQIESTKIKSTIDGVVVAIDVKQGEVVASGQRSVTVADIENKYVSAFIMQQDYNNVFEGMKVTIQDEQTGASVLGEVTYKDYIARETTDSDSVSQYRIEIQPKGTIKNAIGSNINVYITLEERKNTLSLPLTCVQKDAQGTYVYIKESGKIKRADIETGLRDDENIEILRGIDENANVLSDPSGDMEEDK